MAKDNPSIVSAAVVADWLSMTERNVRKLTAAGVFVVVRRGKYDLKACVVAYVEYLRRQGGGMTAAVERSRLLKAQADQAEHNLAVARGSMVDAVAKEAEWFGVLTKVRNRILACPSRVRSRLPHLTRHDSVEIDRELRDALIELGEDR
jgi:phage terminase Nu1 subunit (DNA packaging protein)